ncbi:MAG: hypothetical protein FWH26_02105 [Oscillospiraceae bacterium]|nr:hypothetical protein [Oscillospiraceae bacterium]
MLKKFLAVLLALAAVLSVMTLVANALGAEPAGVMSENPDPPPPSVPPEESIKNDTTSAATVTSGTTKSLAERLSEFWGWFYPVFNVIYEYGYVLVSKALVGVVDIFLRVIGIM